MCKDRKKYFVIHLSNLNRFVQKSPYFSQTLLSIFSSFVLMCIQAQQRIKIKPM